MQRWPGTLVPPGVRDGCCRSLLVFVPCPSCVPGALTRTRLLVRIILAITPVHLLVLEVIWNIWIMSEWSPAQHSLTRDKSRLIPIRRQDRESSLFIIGT